MNGGISQALFNQNKIMKHKQRVRDIMNQTPSPNRQGSEYGLGPEMLKELKLKKMGRLF